MFRLHRNKSSTREKIDFKFSNFQATQVPKNWDRLFISIISLETGKTIAKSSKALVRNGSCQWTETLSESIWVSQDDTSKELEECLFKFVVSMGSARSGILGEVIINMTDYMKSRTSAPVAFSLKKCSHGTTLQLKVHCLTPRTKLRDDKSQDSNFSMEVLDTDSPDMDVRSDGSDSTFVKSVGSSSSKDMASTAHPGELGSRKTSFSASESRHSSDSAEGSVGSTNFSPRNNLNGDVYNPIGRQDSSSSQYTALHGSYSADDPTRSNHSSLKTRMTGSANHSQNHCADATSSLRKAGSSKHLLDAAEDTIEELRAEAKMWERNARKVMVDLDILRKEFSDQSKNQANMDMELSTAYTERDRLKKEVEQLKLLLEESMLKQTAKEEPMFQAQGASQYQKELEDEIKFQKDSNDNLALQLKRNQESNIELVSVLQELEETIEKQKSQIENLSTEETKFTDMENSIQKTIEKNRILALQLQQRQESETNLLATMQLFEKKLEEKNQELESERHLNNQALLNIETEYKQNLSAKEKELASLEAKLCEALKETHTEEKGSVEGGDADFFGEIEALKEKVQELERDCNELTDENFELLLKLKDLQNNSPKSYSWSESEVSELKFQTHHLEEEMKNKNDEDQFVTSETSRVFYELFKQLEIAFSLVRKPWYNSSSPLNNEYKFDLNTVIKSNSTDVVGKKGQLESILNYMVELNKVLDARIVECEEVIKHGEADINKRNKHVAEVQKELEDYILKENNLSLSVQELESMKMELEIKIADQGKVSMEQRAEIMKLEASLLTKDEEIGDVQQCHRELEAQVSDLQAEKIQMEENMETVQRESNITSKCLDDLRNDLVLLSSSVDSHASANKILERKSLELESGKHELELHLSELEQENILLSEHISGLEAQLRYTTDEMKTSRLELESSKSLASSIQDEFTRLGIEMETQNVHLLQKLQDTQNRWSEAQEECEYLKGANLKLEATADSLTEESSSLKKSNGELRKQNLELHDCCTKLEAELRESLNSFVNCSKRVKVLEENISSLLQDFAAKEESVNSELDVLLQENKKFNEKCILGESLLNQMYLEKTVEVETLQREVEHLNQKISATQDERDRTASDAVHEASILREDNTKLESILQEVKSKVNQTENELNTIQTESEMKVQNMMIELAASKQSQEMLKAGNGKMSKLLENYRSSEEKLKTIMNGLELKLTVSDYERQQLMEDAACLKVQLQRVECLQDEVLAFKNELNAIKFEKEKLEASLQLISGDCEELKAEKVSFLEKISTLQRVVSEFENCKQSRVALEEKVLRMEGDLTGKEAQEAELKNELSRIKSANRQLQWKIHQLEEEKDDCGKRTHSLKEEMNLLKEEKKSRSEASGKRFPNFSKADTKVTPIYEEMKHSKGDSGYEFHDGSSDAVEADPLSNIHLLENEVAEALDANNFSKFQLNRLLPEGHPDNSRKSKAEGEVVAKESYERTKSSLQAELRDLQERYFNMSLKYAEVEAQREELVMKLKTSKSGKRWLL